VTASNSAGPSSPASSNPTATVTAAAGLPTNTALPVVSGTAQQGQTLTTTNGSWSGSPTSYAYQWQSCDSAGANCTPIAGATSQSYLLQASDVNHTIRAAVTASNSAGPSSPASSNPTATVTAGPTTTKQFGKTTTGSSWVSPGAGYKFGSVFNLPDPATLVDFKWYTRGGSATQTFTPVIYTTDTAGNPTSLLVVGAEITVTAGQAAGWVTSSLPASSLSPGNYLLALTSGPTSAGAANNMAPTGSGYYNANPYGAPTANWGTINTETATWSFYVDYR
jgi:hypothetical protein